MTPPAHKRPPRQHVVMLSGGVGSWASAKRVVAKHGTDNLWLLFADTLIEDEDLYRFLEEAVDNIGGQFVRIKDGRDPWQVFHDVGILGNTRIDPCSKHLKRDLLDAYLAENFDPANTTVYVGIDWSEEHRFTAMSARKAEAGWHYEAPLCDPPYLLKNVLLAMLEAELIRPPRLYGMGFPHNNCGGFCVKAGHATFKMLLQNFPDRYKNHEAEEFFFRWVHSQPFTILRDRRGGKTKQLSLEDFRKRIEAKQRIDEFDFGGCGCAIDDGSDQDEWHGL